VASTALPNVLYPGAAGDVMATITNPNRFPVTITAVQLPAKTKYATGYMDRDLTRAKVGCTHATSGVFWDHAGVGITTHTLERPLTVPAQGTGTEGRLVVTFQGDAFMASAAPAACEGTYFLMPALAGVMATAGGTVTASPAADAWDS
jgi:hypothetical protein